jgi:NAD(P)-dependent dehydrogenase (short-subunit alcohol dehydrogenase family)
MVALVTGASRGIGRGIALELALAGIYIIGILLSGSNGEIEGESKRFDVCVSAGATVYATGRSLGPEECTEGEGVGGTLRGLQDEAQRLGQRIFMYVWMYICMCYVQIDMYIWVVGLMRAVLGVQGRVAAR